VPRPRQTPATEILPTKRQKELRGWIEQAIIADDLRPGDRIDEQEICRRFGVSRTPVREALLQLEALDLIEFRPRHGAVVKLLTIKQIAAIWEVRIVVEGLAAELATRRMNTAERMQLVAIHEASTAFVEAGQVRDYDIANQRFHEAIHSGCRNDYLAREAQAIQQRLRPYRRDALDRAGELRRSYEGHRAIIAAITVGDEKAAGAAMRQHVSSGLQFIDLVAELPEGRHIGPPADMEQAGANDAA
jgi:DNA-binding GntR family transcriptional regulator